MKKLILSITLLFIFTAQLIAQTTVPLSGRVTNTSGAGILNTRIEAFGGGCPDEEWTELAFTNPFGYYSMDVPASQCDAMAVVPTHKSYSIFSPSAYVYSFAVNPPPAAFINVDFVAGS